ncbi:gastric triacylglycerol lipase-like isoform X1 [Varroa jacobsoni]|uniref:gastric triacylglycerol lipase-like isoform X1 n=1 Tax=Varroa jacobsoni TaxID=62625 RepID=UPI000BF5AB22|nr:gastric triacylglycerol lipase-like isoform X1 [Varroa jacobsoni]
MSAILSHKERPSVPVLRLRYQDGKEPRDSKYQDTLISKLSISRLLGPRSPTRVLSRSTLVLTVLSGVLLFDLFTGGPCVRLLIPLVDYALPVLNEPDFGRSVEELVRSRGFEFETHEVTTKDGYIIEMHRVYHKKFSNSVRPALMLGLPLFCTSAITVVDYRNNTAAYLFADAGYDVWLMNVRGNRFGRRHVFLDPVKDKLAFYDFTHLDIAEFDFPMQIDYVIQYTGQTKVYLTGVSQGAAAAFALLSKRPEYNSKVHAIASYGGFRSLCFSSNVGVVVFSKLAWPLSDLLLNIEYLAALFLSFSPVGRLCARAGNFCGTLMTYVGFKSDHYFNVSRFALYLEHVPAGTSLKTFVYYAQTRQTGCDGSVRDYDYDQGALTSLLISLGWKESMNVKKYGTPEPPLLDAKNIQVPIKIYYSDGDDFVPFKEVQRMAKDIGIPSSNLHRIADDRFSHVNFVFNKDRKDFIVHAIDFFQGGNASWPEDLEKLRA